MEDQILSDVNYGHGLASVMNCNYISFLVRSENNHKGRCPHFLVPVSSAVLHYSCIASSIFAVRLCSRHVHSKHVRQQRIHTEFLPEICVQTAELLNSC